MEGLRHRSLASWSLPLLLSLLLWSLGFCSSLSDEGRALLRFRERVEADPFSALSGWVAGEEDANGHCNWPGVECEDGKVTTLNLKDLCLKGTLAPGLGKLFHLKALILRNNSFYGIIPREFVMLQKLEALDLGYNNLSGPIPPDLGNILSLEFLMIRGNHFLDSVPSELYDLSILSEFEVDVILLPSSRRSSTRTGGNATIRRILQLEKSRQGNTRKLSGHSNASRHLLPPPSPAPSPARSPASPHPSSSPRSPNIQSPKSLEQHHPPPGGKHTAKVPSPKLATRPCTNQIPTTTHGSNCTAATTPKPAPAPPSAEHNRIMPLPPESSGKSSRKAGQAKNVVMLAAIGLGAISLVGLLIFCVLRYRCNKVVTVKPWTTGLSGQLQKAFVTGVPQLKRSELETACEDFSNIIGSLSDCMLYKGTLSSGVEIAVASTLVASAKDWSKHSEAQFRKKIDTLSKVNHKNFVNLIGYCEQEEPFTRMMVFEYAPNGTLYEHLHIKEAEDLDWAARLRISMGIAYCLDHMHQLKAPVILGNLQSSSIYLTDDFAAKISDFEFWSETMATETASRNSSPLDESELNPESIVYKFGILLWEILSGRPPLSEHGLLMDWASDYLRGSKPLRDMVDPNLKLFRDEDLSAICEVIRNCCDPALQVRPTMKEVVSRLREITAVPPDGASPKLSPLWWAELEIVSTEANSI